MSYNQIQLQAIVSEPNSKATSIKNTNIIHLSLFVQGLYLGSETQSRTLCCSVRLQRYFILIQATATLIDICTHKRTITFYSCRLSFPPDLPSLFSDFSLLRFFFLHCPSLCLCMVIPPHGLLSSFSLQFLPSVSSCCDHHWWCQRVKETAMNSPGLWFTCILGCLGRISNCIV